ncbi:MAG: hypothetical protein AAFY65_06765 [Pseudomonadota bacterium]
MAGTFAIAIVVAISVVWIDIALANPSTDMPTSSEDRTRTEPLKVDVSDIRLFEEGGWTYLDISFSEDGVAVCFLFDDFGQFIGGATGIVRDGGGRAVAFSLPRTASSFQCQVVPN